MPSLVAPARNELCSILHVRLKDARVARHLSQSELASLAELIQPGVARLEKGGVLPSLPNFLNLLKALDISADFLIGRDSDPNSHKAETLDDFAQAFALVRPDDRELVLRLIERLTVRP